MTASTPHIRLLVLLMAGLAMPLALSASRDDVADESMRQFLAQGNGSHHYRAIRRLEAQNGKRFGWMEAATDFSPLTGFRYQVTAEGGSSNIRDIVLRRVLDQEQNVIARQPGRFALAHANYTFQPKGIDSDGLVAIGLAPKRQDHVLLAGTMFLRPVDGELVRLQGHLVKNPSFWVKKVDIVRDYERIAGVVLPVALQADAQIRLFGEATFRMTYSYSEVDGRPVASSTVSQR